MEFVATTYGFIAHTLITFTVGALIGPKPQVVLEADYFGEAYMGKEIPTHFYDLL